MRGAMKRLGHHAVAAAFATVMWAGSAAAQGYFGQNHVQYDRFNWRVLETEHFRIHYYPEIKVSAEDAGRMAERAYARLSRLIGHQFREKKPIILFASSTDFAQNNLSPVSEGVGGFTDPGRQRNVLPFTGDYRSFEHVLTHEMVHQFQFDVFSRGRAGANLQALAAVDPPLWMMEGMAEYLSLGPDHRFTDMWMRDAALNGEIPTIEQMTQFPNEFFPYRFGESLMRFIGERWGDQIIGQILEAMPNVGLERAFRRELGMSFDELSDEWKDWLQKAHLPNVVNLDRPRRFSQNILNTRKSGGRIFLAPTLSEDGSKILFLSDGNFWRGQVFIDLWMADTRTGRRIRRLVKSTTNPNAEELRLLYSSSSFSPDGNEVAFVGQRQGKDVLQITRTRGGGTRRIELPLEGVLSPQWSPDGRHLVFTGNQGGTTDLYMVNVDGTGFRRLTNDRYGDYMPVFSPDGSTIAFASDRGGNSDFEYLRFSHLQIALYDMATGTISMVPNQEGLNINPQWAPDGKSVAFISDRAGVPNVFLYDFNAREHYQLTNVVGGVSGITEYSPALTWARKADRMAYVHFEKRGEYTIWSIENPRSLKKAPYRSNTAPPPGVIARADTSTRPAPAVAVRDTVPAALGAVTRDVAPTPGRLPTAPPTPGMPGANVPTPATPGQQVATAAPPPSRTRSFYRGTAGLRASDDLPLSRERDTSVVTVRQMLDSADLELPDATRFRDAAYKVRLEADYVARPSIGYAQDNFGRGLFGGTTIVMSDMVGNNRLATTLQVNGRIQDAVIALQYANYSRRLNYSTVVSQFPFFIFQGQELVPRPDGQFDFDQSLLRYMFRDAGITGLFPRNRFSRFELGINGRSIGISGLTLRRTVAATPFGYQYTGGGENISVPGITEVFAQPSAAFVSDNTLFGYTSPISGRRMRFAYQPNFGTQSWHEAVVDYRRYDPILFNWITVATRFTSNFRKGSAENFIPNYIGNPNGIMWLRGYDRVNALDFGCQPQLTGQAGCNNSELGGSRAFVASGEVRFPLIRQFVLGVLPIQLPPVDGGVFFDAGMAWSAGQTISLKAPAVYDQSTNRFLMRSYGYSIRLNLFNFALLRWDYAIPMDRPQRRGFWQWSLGQAF
jgi:Tol biopolymer transport system component